MATRRILKWTIPVDDFDHPIGAGAVVQVASQYDQPHVVQVWTDEPDADRVKSASARIYGTGQALPEDDEVIGSAIVAEGSLVWHVLRKTAKAGA